MTPPDRDPARAQRQIIALLEKARSTPFEAEAEAATAKAFELMARHHVDEALLEARRAAADPATIIEHDVALGAGPTSTLAWRCWSTCAMRCRCGV